MFTISLTTEYIVINDEDDEEEYTRVVDDSPSASQRDFIEEVISKTVSRTVEAVSKCTKPSVANFAKKLEPMDITAFQELSAYVSSPVSRRKFFGPEESSVNTEAEARRSSMNELKLMLNTHCKGAGELKYINESVGRLGRVLCKMVAKDSDSFVNCIRVLMAGEEVAMMSPDEFREKVGVFVATNSSESFFKVNLFAFIHL